MRLPRTVWSSGENSQTGYYIGHRGDRDGQVMPEAGPRSSVVGDEVDVLLHILIVALDAPSQLAESNQILKREFGGKARKKVVLRRRFTLGPLD